MSGFLDTFSPVGFVVPELLQEDGANGSKSRSGGGQLLRLRLTRRRMEALFAGFGASLATDTGRLAAEAVAVELREQYAYEVDYSNQIMPRLPPSGPPPNQFRDRQYHMAQPDPLQHHVQVRRASSSSRHTSSPAAWSK